MHAAIWVEPDTVDESQIVSTAPRKEDCRTSAETQWRSFVLKVPQHPVQPIVHATTDDAGCTRRCSGTTAAKSASRRGKTVRSATSAGDYAACALHCRRMHPRCASSGVHMHPCALQAATLSTSGAHAAATASRLQPNAPQAATTCAPFSEGRYGYPRPRCNEHHIDEDTKRWVYRCEKKEDERLSPYIAVWLLATGEP